MKISMKLLSAIYFIHLFSHVQLNDKIKSLIDHKKTLLSKNTKTTLNIINEAEITGPQCIPLRSNNINSNPYHHSLLSVPGSEIRSGLGLPEIVSTHSSVSCDFDDSERQSKESCKFSVSKSETVSVSDSYSITLGFTQSFSKSLGKSITNGKTNSFTNSIGKTIENSISKGLTLTDDVSMSQQVSESLQNTIEKSSGISNTEQSEESEVETISEDKSGTITSSVEKSYSESDTTDLSETNSKGGSSSRSDK